MIHDKAQVDETAFVQETAHVGPRAILKPDVKVWHKSIIRRDALIGRDSMIGSFVVVGPLVNVGQNCRVQNHVSLFEGVTLERDVFVGPNVTFTNVKRPRAQKVQQPVNTYIREGATLGANTTILPGITVHKHAFVGAGALVTKDVPAFAVVTGKDDITNWMCKCGRDLQFVRPDKAVCYECEIEANINR